MWPIIDQLLGTSCPLCNHPGTGICGDCRQTLPVNDHACPVCAQPLPSDTATGALCADCLVSRPAFDSARVPLRYAAPVDGLIADFKFHHGLAVGRALSELLADNISACIERPACLIPVPADRAALRERGFNQAAEIARHLSRRLGIPWQPTGLRRLHHASTQRGLDRAQRRKNVAKAFLAGHGLPEFVALVDDVVTSGATADAAARALKKAGVKRVDLWAIARTPRRP